MNKSNKTIWVDVTDMVVWKGNFTGIQRVVNSYAERYVGIGARCFVYDKVDDRFVQISESLLELMSDREPEPQKLTTRQRIKYSLGAPYYRLPASMKSRLRPVTLAINSVIRTLAAKVFDVPPVAESRFSKYEEATFARGDMVLLLGAGWNENNLADKICELKLERGVRIVQHINDLLPIYQPHLFADELPPKFNKYIGKILPRADLITVISQATADDVSRYVNENSIPKMALKIVRLGEDPGSNTLEKVSDSKVRDKFILSVGTIEIRKNYIILYQAVKLALAEGRVLPQIVIVGKHGWLTEDLIHVIEKDPAVQGKIVLLSGVSDEQLNWLYDKALFTIFPSLCEGWGLPVVESLQKGKFCLASGVSSMAEIAPTLIGTFNPLDVRDCMNKIIKSVENVNVLNRKVLAAYKPHTWDDSFAQHLKAVNGLLEHN